MADSVPAMAPLHVDMDFLPRRIRVEEPPRLLGQPHGDLGIRVERIPERHVLIESRPLHPLEGTGQAKSPDPRRQFVELGRVAGIACEDATGVAEFDTRPFPSDEHERGGGDQLVARFVAAIVFEEGEEPIGQVGEFDGIGSEEELDDASLGVGHGRLRHGLDESRSPAGERGLGVTAFDRAR